MYIMSIYTSKVYSNFIFSYLENRERERERERQTDRQKTERMQKEIVNLRVGRA
jgi:hypothetical protein